MNTVCVLIQQTFVEHLPAYTRHVEFLFPAHHVGLRVQGSKLTWGETVEKLLHCRNVPGIVRSEWKG